MTQKAQRHRWLAIAVLVTVGAVGISAWQTSGDEAAKSSASPRRGSEHDAERETKGERGRESGEKEADDPAEATRWFLRTRSPDRRSPIDVGRYAAADLHARAMPRFASGTGQVLAPQGAAATAAVDPALAGWTPLGPGNIGGRVRSLVIDPTATATMYAGGVDGGVWKTTDGGASWRPTADLLPSIAVASLVMDPTDHNVLYAGTGEGQFNGDAVQGEGILRTADGGTTWQRLPATVNVDFNYVNALVVSPNDHRRIYAGTKTGIWRSADSGTTWSSVWAAADCLDLQARSVSGKDVVLGSCGSFEGGAVVRTTDGGAVTPAWTSVLAVTGQARTSLAFAPSAAGVVYALLASTENSSALSVYRSTDSGATWSVRSSGTGAPQIGDQGWYDSALAVDPTDSNRIWVGFQNTACSTDGGATWTTLDYYSCGLHPDHHRIVFPPNYDGTTNTTMYIANDGGIFRTTNAWGTPNDCDPTTGVLFTSLNHGLAVTQFYDGAVYPDGHSYFGGAQDNGTSRGTDALGPDGWSSIFGADGGYVEVDPTNTQRLYAETQSRSLLRSEDGGSSWTGITNGLTGSHSFISPFVVDPRDARTMWSAGEQIFRSTDGGDHWVPASTSVIDVSALAVAPHDSNTVIVGGFAGAVYRNSQALQSDGTTTWQYQSTALLGGNISSVAFDPSNQSVVYATVSQFGAQHVWRSGDGGATFVSIDGTGATGLPDIPASSIVVDPADGRRLYVGTDLGVFVSLDTGATWAHEVSGFPNALTVRLRIQGDASGRTLYAFTHGRGAWRVPLGAPTRPINDDFASPTVLSDPSGSLTATNAAATREAGEPTHAATGSASIWYQWVAPKSGQLTVDTAGSNFDTLLGAYTGSTVGALTQLAANDNAAVGDTSSRVSITVTAGTTYAIAVDGRTTATGTVGLHWTFAPKSNDAFATAEVLSGNSGTTSGSNTDATLEPSEPQHWGFPGGHSIWYRFTAPADGTLTVNTSGSNFDTVLAVYRGSSLSGLTKLGANDDFDALQSRVGSIPVTAGASYAIAVDGYGAATGTVNLQWAFRTVAAALEPAPGRLTP